MSAASQMVCDQAIFTSIRTPTGQGYRIVAASRGVRADEKADITARSPSHGSLYESGPEAVGLLSCRLSSGRFCVGYVCHAGVEHTGRGGQRVYTHMALLDEAAYRSFDSNPVAVHRAIGEAIGKAGPLLKPPPHLEPLVLPPGTRDWAWPEAVDWIWPSAAMLLEGHRLVLTGESKPLAMLNWIMLGLPRGLREHVNASTHLRFSPSRGMHLVLIENNEPQLQRQLPGQQMQAWACDSKPPEVPARCQAWFALLRRWHREGRFEDIARLTCETCADSPVEALERVAAICEDADRLNDAAPEALDEIVGRYASGWTGGTAEQALVRQLQSQADQMRAHLSQRLTAV
ncbi:MAG: GAP1-N2 domain-containing protein [Phycisphaerae bacterium]